jgi:hypothetical protein
VSQETVFNDEISATSAIKGIYAGLTQINGFTSGSNICIASLTGLSSDELHNYLSNSIYAGIEQNNISADDPSIFNIWATAYKTIYDCNSAIEGLQSSKALPPPVKNQLLGEALFIRSYCHFYLVNLFGAIPLITSTNYETNSTTTRTVSDEIYNQIKNDLTQARTLLNEAYQEGTERIRVNKSSATALLARVNLYSKDWEAAESMASVILENTTTYKLADTPTDVFLTSSREAIWQIKLPLSSLKTYTTYEGFFFNIQSDFDLGYYVLSKNLVQAFKSNDLRRENWIGRYISNDDTVYYAKKYKEKYASDPPKENATVLRLAEQFLIRAEARAMQEKLHSAIDDLDAIRKRAGLPLIQNTNPTITKDDLLLAIEQERRTELFTEGGHRWFDLKRTNRATQVLESIKPLWNNSDELYPIPQTELAKNPNLQYQNQGY